MYTGTITLTADVVLTAAEGLNVVTNIADHTVAYNEGVYKVVEKPDVAKIGEQKFKTLQAAINAATAGQTCGISF